MMEQDKDKQNENVKATEDSPQSLWYSILITSLQPLSILLFLTAWASNSGFLQGVTTGSFCPGNIPFDKPVFLSWFDYNFTILSLFVVYPYARFYLELPFSFYIMKIWAGKIGLMEAVKMCAGMNYTFLLLNSLYTAGLKCMPIAFATALFQLQAGFTVGFSVCLLGDRFRSMQALGIIISLIGVMLIVVPPLFDEDNNEEERHTCSKTNTVLSMLNEEERHTCSKTNTVLSMLSFIAASILWAAFQIFWRFMLESKHPQELTRLEGLMDTFMSLAVIGLCNLFIGWPFVAVSHLVGFESFQIPPSTHWPILNINALVEYCFDSTSAIAIFMTSPVVTAVTGPLVILLGVLWDYIVYGSYTDIGIWGWLGVICIVCGVMGIETEFNFMLSFGQENREEESEVLLKKDVSDKDTFSGEA